MASTTAPTRWSRTSSGRSPRTSRTSAATPDELIASGDTVAVVAHSTGTGKATGKELDLRVMHVWGLRDGKIARFRQFADTVKFLEVTPAEIATS